MRSTLTSRRTNELRNLRSRQYQGSRQDFTNQLFALREFAAKQGWTIYCEYVDRVTGSTDERPEFPRMFEESSQRRFDVLLFWSLDRLSREGALETLQHLQRLTGYGVAWRSFTEQYLDSTGIFREAVIGILAVMAKQERVRLSQRTRAGLERVRREVSNSADQQRKLMRAQCARCEPRICHGPR